MTSPRLNLLVLRTRDLSGSRRLYECFGLAFTEEQHGSGPVHLAAEANGVVVELYPLADASRIMESSVDVRLGLEVHDVDEAVSCAVRTGAVVHSSPRSLGVMRHAVVVDLDGRRIELISPSR